MLVIVCYDISTTNKKGQRRLYLIAKILDKYGQRVQNSVFECNINYSEYVTLKSELQKIICKDEDIIRLYNLGNTYKKRIEQIGNKKIIDLTDVLVL